jgi:hypothetical protein
VGRATGSALVHITPGQIVGEERVLIDQESLFAQIRSRGVGSAAGLRQRGPVVLADGVRLDDHSVETRLGVVGIANPRCGVSAAGTAPAGPPVGAAGGAAATGAASNPMARHGDSLRPSQGVAGEMIARA